MSSRLKNKISVQKKHGQQNEIKNKHQTRTKIKNKKKVTQSFQKDKTATTTTTKENDPKKNIQRNKPAGRLADLTQSLHFMKTI